jgi:hypothetical protein
MSTIAIRVYTAVVALVAGFALFLALHATNAAALAAQRQAAWQSQAVAWQRVAANTVTQYNRLAGSVGAPQAQPVAAPALVQAPAPASHTS